MATTQLSDVINPIVFKDLPANDSPEKTAIYQSGVVVRNRLLDELASGPGKTAELPFWNDIDPTDTPNISTDDPTQIAAADKVAQGEQIARKAFLNKGLSAADLVSEIAMGPKAMQHIKNRVDTYWTRQMQRRLIASAAGVKADNIASNSGDMVFSVAAESTGAQSATTRFNRDAFTDAAYTLGDAASELRAIVMHSHVMQQAVKNNDIIYIPDVNGQLVIPTYMGLRTVVDDNMTVRAGTNSGFVYTSILFAEGAFGWGEGEPENPVEVERQAAQGNGGGVETLWTRKTWIIHPFGYQNTGTPASTSFTLAELALATTWARVIERKNVKIAFLDTN